jgi:hypothetical protein
VFPFTWAPFNAEISHLTAKCASNVFDRGIVEITANSVLDDDPKYAPRNAADLGTNSCFFSENKLDQWISWDFKSLRIAREARRNSGDSEESFSLEGLLQPGNCAEDLEAVENQEIVAAVIQASLTQADPAEAHGPRNRKCCSR